MSNRSFQDTQAKRERVPMLVGLVGPSGSGKTYSALRLASGMRRVTGGEIYYIDTESRRALHYGDEFEFRHISMEAPFSPLDYLAAIEHCVDKRAGVVIIDSMSHEHEGPGGVLDMHEKALDKMAGGDWKKRNKMTFAAWAKPKAERRQLINAVLRLGINAIFCFRAKEKLRIVRGKDPESRGWQPIGGEEFTYEMTINCLMYPGSGGVPNWSPDEREEMMMLKRPEKLRGVFQDGKPLSEETGEGLARWAEGDKKSSPEFDGVVEHLKNAPSLDDLKEVAAKWSAHEWASHEREAIKRAIGERKVELLRESEDQPPTPSDPIHDEEPPDDFDLGRAHQAHESGGA